MSVAWYIVLERPIPRFDHGINGKAIGRAGDELEVLAKKLGVEPLMNFFSASPQELLGFAADHGVELQHNPPPEHWFSAEQGLKTVLALVEAVEGAELDRKDQILADLNEFQKVLRLASEHGVDWHLAVDF